MTELVDGLQDALAGEHAAVYVYSVLAAQTSQTAQPRLWQDLETAWAWHRDARDTLVARIVEQDQAPVAASPSYALPNAVAGPGQVLTAALVVERRATDLYGTLVARTVGADRSRAIAGLEACAVRQLTFRGRPESFPGTGLTNPTPGD